MIRISARGVTALGDRSGTDGSPTRPSSSGGIGGPLGRPSVSSRSGQGQAPRAPPGAPAVIPVLGWGMADWTGTAVCRQARRRALLLVAALALTGCGSTKTDLPSQPILPAPTGLRIQSDPSSVQLSWEPVSGASFYRIYWAPGSTVTAQTGSVLRSSTTTLSQSGLQEGTTYAYFVAAVDERDREGRSSSVITATLGTTPRDAPQNVRAVAGDAQVTIDWDRIPSASGYRVVVTSSQGTSTVVPDPSEPPFVHRRLLNRTTYTYTVQAKYGEQLGPPSLAVEATPMPTRPGIPVFTGVQVRTVASLDSNVVASRGVVSLQWTAADHATNYQVYAAKEQEAEIPLIPPDRPLKDLFFSHEPVDYDAVYEYRVEALNDGVSGGQLEPPVPPVRAWVPRPLENGAAPYHYVVRAFDATVELATSAEASGVPIENVMLVPPTAVRVSDTPRDLGGSLTISWTPSTTRGVDAQRLFRSSTGDPDSYASLQTFDDHTTSMFTDTTVTDGIPYFYALRALAGDSEELSSSGSGIALSNSALVPPTDLSVADTPDDAGGALTITWVPSTARDVTVQRLYRSTSAGGGYDLVTESNNPLLGEFLDQPVSTGTTYYYAVLAVAGGQESALSNEGSGVAEVNSEPFPPRSLQAVDRPADLGGAIDLSWTPSVSSTATEQRLYRSTSTGGPYQLVAVFNDRSTSRYTDFGVPSAPSATGLVVVPQGGDLLITWSPVAEAVDGYRLYWWERDGSGNTLDSGIEPDIITERFVHRDLTSGSHYVYVVQVQGFPAVSTPADADAPRSE